MKSIIFITIVIVISSTSCKKYDIAKGIPKCVENKIHSFETEACNDGNVKQYTFQGNTVYVFDPGTCGADMTSEVIDSDCHSLGFLGGFAGNTKINGEEFSHAKFIIKIWEK